MPDNSMEARAFDLLADLHCAVHLAAEYQPDGKIGAFAKERPIVETVSRFLHANQYHERPSTDVAPIPMLLFCPMCGAQHIDEPEERAPDWDNPPHRSHLCHACGCIWRPADVATVGVVRIATVGKADTFGESNCAAIARPHASTDVAALVERLRAWTSGLPRRDSSNGNSSSLRNPDGPEAADLIERLSSTAAPAMDREAAQRLQDHMEQFHGVCLPASAWDAAIAALSHSVERRA